MMLSGNDGFKQRGDTLQIRIQGAQINICRGSPLGPGLLVLYLSWAIGFNNFKARPDFTPGVAQ